MSAVDEHGGWPVLLGSLTAGSDLSRQAAQAAMTDILAGEATAAQIAGLIVALRMKGESVEEMTGLVAGMRGAAERLQVPTGAIDIVGTGGSAHRRSHALNVSTMASIVAAAAGAVVCKHGNRRASSTSGSFDFLEAIGVAIDLAPEAVTQCVEEVGVGFAFARTFHPAMRFAGPVRAELGIPTVFNVLGPLAHPGHVKRQVIGTADPVLAAKMAAVLHNVGVDRVWVVSGHDGLDELSTVGQNDVHIVEPDGIVRRTIDPVDLGLGRAEPGDLRGGDPTMNATIFAAILDGSDRGPRRDIVVLNAAAGLVVAGVVDDLDAAVVAAGAAIDDGRAGETLARLVAVSNANVGS